MSGVEGGPKDISSTLLLRGASLVSLISLRPFDLTANPRRGSSSPGFQPQQTNVVLQIANVCAKHLKNTQKKKKIRVKRQTLYTLDECRIVDVAEVA